ncbi:MAG TPA: chromate transporter [Capillibacterium sp.]
MAKSTKQASLSALFFSFFKVGAFTIGGGYAMLPVIQREVIENHNWLSTEEFVEILAIAEMTPGPVAINTATFVGYRTAGVPGSVMATLGVVLPSFSMILAIAVFFPRFASHPIAQRIFYGIRPAVVALIAHALYKLGKKILVDGFGCIIALAVFLAQLCLGVPPIPTLLLAAGAGFLFTQIKGNDRQRTNNAEKHDSPTGGEER